MSTNPNNAVGTNAAYDGRTSVKAFNDGIGAYSRGILSGWACSPNTGMTVSLGGDGTTRDVAIAEDVGGNKITVNNISESPINVTMSAAPATNSRIDSIVAYVDNPPQGAATSIDNPGACGLIAVNGTAAADPVAPNDSAIRTAITADGASGATAYYVVLANITVASGTTTLTSEMIEAGNNAELSPLNLGFTGAISTQTITWESSSTTVGATTCTMIPLDGDGLTLCTSSGVAWTSNPSSSGLVNIKGVWGTPPKRVVGWVADACLASDISSFKTYAQVTTTSIDIWVEKTSSNSRDILAQLMVLAYF